MVWYGGPSGSAPRLSRVPPPPTFMWSVMLLDAVTSKYVERFGNRHFRGAVVSMQGWRVYA